MICKATEEDGEKDKVGTEGGAEKKAKLIYQTKLEVADNRAVVIWYPQEMAKPTWKAGICV